MNKTTDLADRLELFIKHEGVTPFLMNKAVGLSRALLSKTIENHQGLNSTTLEKISKVYPNLNMDWLITGRGEMLMQEETKTADKAQKPLPDELECSLYRQIMWHLLLQDSYAESHKRLIEISKMLDTMHDKATILSDQILRIRQAIESHYRIQSENHGLYEMTLRIAAGDDGKYVPSQLKDRDEIERRIKDAFFSKK